MKLKYRVAATFATFALMLGTVPGTITNADAFPVKQMLDKKKWPYTSTQKAILVAGSIAATIALVALISKKEKPTSP